LGVEGQGPGRGVSMGFIECSDGWVVLTTTGSIPSPVRAISLAQMLRAQSLSS
jgi:hypothetical protein